MNQWVLRIELNGEWEECRFPTRTDALSTFAALAADYQRALKRAILFTPAAAVAGLAGVQSARLDQQLN